MKKKILFIPTMVLPFPDTKGGAIERLMTMLIEENEKEALADFYILSVEDDEAREIARKYEHTEVIYRKRKSLFLEKVFMYTYVAFRKFFKISLPYFNPNYLIVPALVRKIQPDFVVMEGSGGENLSALSKLINREKLFLHLHHEFSPNSTLDKIYGTVLCPSAFIKERWFAHKHHLKQKAEIVFNGIDSERFLSGNLKKDKIREERGFQKEDFLILFCGRIIKEKGVRVLIDAFLKAKIPSSKLVIIGSPDFGNQSRTEFVGEIQSLTKEHSNISFLGYVKNEEMPVYYKMANLLMVTTLIEEAAGMVAIEAMCCGLPILATDTGGLPEYTGKAASIVIKDGLSENELSERLASELKRLSENQEKLKEMAELGVKQAQKFTKEQYYKSYMKSLGFIKE